MSNRSYNAIERLLHRLALSSNGVSDAALQIEKNLFAARCPEDQGRHVFVAGLARAGTTLLMRLLYETGQFSSLTYRDMPFVMAPNLWQRLSGSSRKAARVEERVHGDGVLVDFDSPEALEEIFWRVTCGEDYLLRDCLVPMAVDDEAIAEFRLYVRLILLRHGGQRYLSKNNNNILRLKSISRAFPEALIVVPFRHPLEQAESLRQQHRHFCQLQQEDRFTRQYMDWLVHHEFGLGHRPFLWPGDRAPGYSPESTNYWLQLWYNTYARLAEGRVPVQWFCYDDFCRSPESVWRGLALRADLSPDLPAGISIRAVSGKKVDDVNGELLEKSLALYQRLSTFSAERLHGY